MWKILVFSAVVFLTACRPDSVIPPDNGNVIPGGPGGPGGPGEEQTVSIAALKSLYTGVPTQISKEIRIAGTIVSTDRFGNFARTLVIEDETSGIELRIPLYQMFKTYIIETRVHIRCTGLWLGSYGGTLQLGGPPTNNSECSFLTPTLIAEHITYNAEYLGEPIARTLKISELSARHISTLVAFEDVHFVPEEMGLTWCEPDSTTPTDRHIVDPWGNTLTVRTSAKAEFGRWPLPVETGRIEGILSLFNNRYYLTVTDSQKFTHGYD